MTVFEVLFVSHVLGDWLLQTEWQAANKRRMWSALLLHLVIYHAVMAIWLVLAFDFSLPVLAAVMAGLFVTHAILDRQWPIERLVRGLRLVVQREPERWFMVMIDQAVHLVLIAAAAMILVHFGR